MELSMGTLKHHNQAAKEKAAARWHQVAVTNHITCDRCGAFAEYDEGLSADGLCGDCCYRVAKMARD